MGPASSTTLASHPLELVEGAYYALATAFVSSLHPEDGATALVSWDLAPLWFIVTVGVAAIATIPHRQDATTSTRSLPDPPRAHRLCLGGRSAADQSRLRVVLEAMQAPRLALFTVLIGIGLLLLLASKTLDRPRLRRPLLALAAVIVLANGIGSAQLIADNQHWIKEQPELARRTPLVSPR